MIKKEKLNNAVVKITTDGKYGNIKINGEFTGVEYEKSNGSYLVTIIRKRFLEFKSLKKMKYYIKNNAVRITSESNRSYIEIDYDMKGNSMNRKEKVKVKDINILKFRNDDYSTVLGLEINNETVNCDYFDHKTHLLELIYERLMRFKTKKEMKTYAKENAVKMTFEYKIGNLKFNEQAIEIEVR